MEFIKMNENIFTMQNILKKLPVYIVCLNNVPFLPYIYGLLRSYIESIPELASHYSFPEPFFYNFLSPNEICERIEKPAILGLSCYVWNFNKSMKIARLLKQIYPDVLVVAGGPQIPDRVNNFFEIHPYIDLMVHGEGEVTFQKILFERLSSSPNWFNVPGISFKHQGHVFTTKKETLDLQQACESPYLAGYLDNSMQLCRTQNVDYFAPWETNRGCPFSCTFCDWGSSTMSKVRKFKLERIMKEIEFFGKHQVPKIHINDANFGMIEQDVEIAKYISNTKNSYQFPRKIYLNFAKNSSNRVYEISKIWHEAGLLENTTLSMQATNDQVLEAIKRKNIPIEQYEALQARYSKVGMPTYTEIILGLPEETCQSFKQGLDRILLTGNHDDIRIYELTILPNAPIADPEMQKKYALVTIDKELFEKASGKPKLNDEVEYIPTVIQTNTLSTKDWIDCSIYSRMIQFLHSGYLTRYLAIYLHTNYQIPYYVFYAGMEKYFILHPETVLGKILITLYDYYKRYTQHSSSPTLNYSLFSKEACNLIFSSHGDLQFHDQFWLCVVADLNKFFDEIWIFLQTLNIEADSEALKDMIRFQKDIILTPHYNPEDGKIATYSYDFPSYFINKTQFTKKKTKIAFCDTHMDANKMIPLAHFNIEQFVKSVVPSSALIKGQRYYYQHQLNQAKITYYD